MHQHKFLIFILCFALAACGGGGSSSSAPEPELEQELELELEPESVFTGTLTGSILNFDTGEGIQSATVSVGGKVTTTASDGSYTLHNIAFSPRILVDISGTGFADNTKVTSLSTLASTNRLTVKLLPIDVTLNFDPSIQQTIIDTGSPASVSIPANGLVKNDGSSPDGDVTINLTVIDPTQDISLMPGELLTAIAGSNLGTIESFGAITATFTDASGNDLNLGSSSTSIIRIPLADKTGNPPTAIPLYFYNKVTGLWVEEGTAILVQDGSDSYYEGTVSHFSTWNADFLYDQVFVDGCVQDITGTRLTNITVNSEGDDYAGSASTTTDTFGNFSVAVKPNASALIFAEKNGERTNTTKVEMAAFDQQLDECLILNIGGTSVGEVAVSIKLSWGENPSDLDSHLVGPNFHVSFGNQGSLIASPFTQLDVDDIDSFGPEVITIFSFETVGTYTYSVHDFSGLTTENASNTITNSPARVELNVNGSTSVFVPPASEGTNETWNVFEFVVAEDGSVIINTLNTWSPFSPLSVFD